MSTKYKIIILGEGEVGKTSLLCRYINGTFNEREIHKTTKVYWMENKIRVDLDSLQIRIWDTGGQEKYHSLQAMYYRNARGALLVYALTDKYSFQRVKKWVIELKKFCSEIKIIVVGAKADLSRHVVVDKKEVDEYCKKIGVKHIITSAKANLNVTEAFLSIIKTIHYSERRKKKIRKKKKIGGGGFGGSNLGSSGYSSIGTNKSSSGYSSIGYQGYGEGNEGLNIVDDDGDLRYNRHGALGTGEGSPDLFSPKPVKNLPIKCQILKVALGYQHSILVTDNFKAYAAGYNQNGQLGEGNFGNLHKFTLISKFKNFNTIDAGCGYYHSIFVVCSALYEIPKIFGTGCNDHGALGVNKEERNISPPMQVFFPKGIRTVKIEGGYSFTVFLCDDGMLYIAGSINHEYGTGFERVNKKVPEFQKFFENKPVDDFSAGYQHVFCYTRSKEMYSLGFGGYGQLGVDQRKAKFFTKVMFFKDKNVKQVLCGVYHTMVLLESKELYAFGYNDYGQLGMEERRNQKTPKKIEFDENMYIDCVITGSHHTYLIDNDRKMYCTGLNDKGQLGLGVTTSGTISKFKYNEKLIAEVVYVGKDDLQEQLFLSFEKEKLFDLMIFTIL